MLQVNPQPDTPSNGWVNPRPNTLRCYPKWDSVPGQIGTAIWYRVTVPGPSGVGTTGFLGMEEGSKP
jgi:hypothetical protein